MKNTKSNNYVNKAFSRILKRALKSAGPTHTCNASFGKEEAGRLLKVQGHLGCKWDTLSKKKKKKNWKWAGEVAQQVKVFITKTYYWVQRLGPTS